jgi:hypothetical protein
MFGRCNICVAVATIPQASKNTIKGMSNMKKIKSKLVTIVTDNVLLVGIVGNKNRLARMLQEGSG